MNAVMNGFALARHRLLMRAAQARAGRRFFVLRCLRPFQMILSLSRCKVRPHRRDSARSALIVTFYSFSFARAFTTLTGHNTLQPGPFDDISAGYGDAIGISVAISIAIVF
jgi:hypothetical protein